MDFPTCVLDISHLCRFEYSNFLVGMYREQASEILEPTRHTFSHTGTFS